MVITGGMGEIGPSPSIYPFSLYSFSHPLNLKCKLEGYSLGQKENKTQVWHKVLGSCYLRPLSFEDTRLLGLKPLKFPSL